MSYCKGTSFGTAYARIARAALACVSLFAVVFSMSTDGFGQSTGSIRGQVKNLSTGKFLTNAQVVIEGTNQRAYTDEYGEYRFSNVALGDVRLTASYVGLGEKSLSVFVEEGGVTAPVIALYAARAGLDNEEVFELEAFTVDGSDFDSNAIAQQERKISSNLKLVQHADALGEIAEGNIGEFLKNMPGVAIDYVAADARSIKLRGMSADFTTVTVDGASMASAASSGKGRNFELEQVSLTNIEQLEVTKLPRPDNPANSMGGSINLVSKNAFAQGGRKITYKAFANWNGIYGFDFDKSPGWTSDSYRTKTNPSFEFGYSDVFLNDRLGASFTVSQSNQFNIQRRFNYTGDYRILNDGSVANERIQIQDGPKFSFRQSVAANFDYKASENTIFTLRSQVNWYDAEFNNRNYNFAIGTDMANSREGHIEGSFTSNNNVGASVRNKKGVTTHVDLGAKHTFGDWKIDYGFTSSIATNEYRDGSEGYVEGMSTRNFNVTGQRLSYDFENMMVAYADIVAKDSSGNVLPNYGFDLSKGRLAYLRHRPNDSEDKRSNLRLNVTRLFELGDNKGSFKFGYDRSGQHRDTINREWRYNVNSNSPTASKPLSDFVDEVYKDITPGFGYPGFTWLSSIQLEDYLQANMGDFTLANSTALSAQQGSYLNLDETITSYYVMGSIGFAGDKGLFTTGIRYEDTKVEGLSPVGSKVVPDPTTENPNNTKTLSTMWLEGTGENGVLAGEFIAANQSYDTYHPSAHLRYNLTPQLTARVSAANTIGRPSFGNMFGAATISYDTSSFEYTLNLKNPNLTPRRSDNLDFTLEYYFGDTSLLSASVFQNDIKNFEGTTTVPMSREAMAAAGIPYQAEYDDVDNLKYTFTAGDATVRGLELSWNQSLDHSFIPEFFKASSIYANGTFLDLDGSFEGTDYADFTDTLPGFAKETISYGVIFDKRPFSLKFRWNTRGEETQSGTRNLRLVNGTVLRPRIHDEERTTLDINGDYKVNDNMSVFFSVRNAKNAPYRWILDLSEVEGSSTDERVLYREESYGAQWSLGVKGKF
ncbi:TonB-dependent receptor [Pelagicoccus sp. SDUM812005]|nr:TonB-dependent receptor [Pelagicoccus sp. SDUM812005]